MVKKDKKGITAVTQSQKRFRIFLNKIHSNDPDCKTLTEASKRLLEQNKQGLGGSKPVL
jgi:hypothetical protein